VIHRGKRPHEPLISQPCRDAPRRRPIADDAPEALYQNRNNRALILVPRVAETEKNA